MVAPGVAVVVAMPFLKRYLGTERVGFMTLAWALVGYFSLFDLGIGRALTKLVAEKVGAGDRAQLGRLIWTALALMLGLGIGAGLALAVTARWLVESLLNIPTELRSETMTAIRLLGLSVPLVVSSAGFRGILEAQGRFLTSNAVRAPLGVWLFASPLLVIPFGSQSLAWVAGILFAGRLLAWCAYVVACLRSLPVLREGLVLDARHVGPLLRFGGWMTVSNVISPLMAYMDRFLLGSRLSLQEVAWYATPFELVTKVLLLASAVASVLFPMFSALAAQRREEVQRLARLGSQYMGLLVFVPTFAASLFAKEGLTVWLGPVFAAHAERVVQIIALGCLINSVASVPFALLQGAGRPDLTAKIHLFELPVYAVAVFALTARFGIAGTAIAWTLRVTLDLFALEIAARNLSGQFLRPSLRASIASGGLIVLFGVSLLVMPLWVKAILFVATVAGVAVLVWSVLLERDGLSELKQRLRRRLSSLSLQREV
jgi:O-antigen/teichoic acid export membrane protein